MMILVVMAIASDNKTTRAYTAAYASCSEGVHTIMQQTRLWRPRT